MQILHIGDPCSVQVLLRLQAVLDGMQQADEDDELVFITRLVQLACSARAQLREKSSGLPAASSTLLKKLYPTLMVASLADAASYEGALWGLRFILRGFKFTMSGTTVSIRLTNYQS